MALTEAQFRALEANIQVISHSYFKENTDYIPLLFNVIKSTRARELHRGRGAFGRMQPWNGNVFYDTLADGYEKEYRPGKFSQGLEIDADMYEDEEYDSIKGETNALLDAIHDTLQYDAASVFNNAFSSSYTGPDGVALCSASHHLVAGDDTQSNTDTLDMNVTNVDTVLTRMNEWNNDRGNQMCLQGNLIISGNYWREAGKKIVGSELEPFTADNQKNTITQLQNGEVLKYMCVPRITGRKWFVVSTKVMKGGKGLNWVMRKDPRKLERDSDFDAETLKWKAVGRWGYGWDNWFWCYGNNPA
jgi:hypothetical protein